VLFNINSSYQVRNGTTSIHKLLNLLRSNINNDIVLSTEFERGLASLLVMISPIVPCFAAECWNAFAQLIGESHILAQYGFDLNKPVYEQMWPKVIDPEFKYIIRFTYRDAKGKEQECQRIRVPLRELGSWSESEIRQLLGPLAEECEWINIVKHCSVVVRIKNEFTVRQLLSESQFELVE